MPNLHVADVLVRPVITEKNTRLTERGQYTFEVAPTANKIQVRDAVQRIFKVDVVAVNMLVVKGKRKRILKSRNFREFGRDADWKKAIVTLAPGQTIDIFGDI
jgi:large subunit ribosomal protein L23